MNKLDKDYCNLQQDIIDTGIKKTDRTGTGTLSVFGRQIRHQMSDGFPILTTKKVSFKNVTTELLWFLKGRTDLRYLLENNCHIWDGDCYQYYLKTLLSLEKNGNHLKMNKWMRDNGDETLSLYTKEQFIEKIKTDDVFNKQWGDLGKVYGFQWRKWGAKKIFGQGEYILYDGIDQIQNLINELKINPDSRRLLISAWAVHDLPNMVLPPCHYGFQLYTRELDLDERIDIYHKKNRNPPPQSHDYFSEHMDAYDIPKRAISLMFNMRSVDTFLGLPYNITSYSLLLSIIAKEVNMVPEEVIGNLGDTHLYLNHIEQTKEQITRTSFDLPTLKFSNEFNNIMESDKIFSEKIELFTPEMFSLENYQSHPTIKAPLSN